MSYYAMPIYGPVTSNGKQTISVYENDGAGHTYTTDKCKVDEFKSNHDKAVSDGRKSLAGFLTAFAASIVTYTENAKVRAFGWGAAALGMAYGIYKLVCTYKDTKAAEKVLEDIRNTSNAAADNVKAEEPAKKEETTVNKDEEAAKA